MLKLDSPAVTVAQNLVRPRWTAVDAGGLDTALEGGQVAPSSVEA